MNFDFFLRFKNKKYFFHEINIINAIFFIKLYKRKIDFFYNFKKG